MLITIKHMHAERMLSTLKPFQLLLYSHATQSPHSLEPYPCQLLAPSLPRPLGSQCTAGQTRQISSGDTWSSGCSWGGESEGRKDGCIKEQDNAFRVPDIHWQDREGGVEGGVKESLYCQPHPIRPPNHIGYLRIWTMCVLHMLAYWCFLVFKSLPAVLSKQFGQNMKSGCTDQAVGHERVVHNNDDKNFTNTVNSLHFLH